MIACNLNDSDRYRSLSPRIDAALTWLRDNITSLPEPGTCIEIADGVTVKSEAPALVPIEKACLEAHRRYIDIHVPLRGMETIGWAPVAALVYPRGEYDEAKDVIFYGDASQSRLHLRPGQIAIFFPEDAHAPNIGLGNHRKLCVKILV